MSWTTSHPDNKFHIVRNLYVGFASVVPLAYGKRLLLSATRFGIADTGKGPYMSKKRMIYEGKAKILYEGPEPGTLIQYFKDDATAFNAEKKAVLDGKGVLNNRISEFIMTHLGGIGIPHHFLKRLNMREQLIKKVEIIPLEVIIRNIATGSMSKRLGIENGTVLPRAIVEFCYKKDDGLATRLSAKSTSMHSAGQHRRKSMT